MIALKASAIVAAACLATTLMRGRSAAWRHAVLATAILAAGGLPILERIAPGWGASIVPAPTIVPGRSMTLDLLRLIGIAGAAVAYGALLAGVARLAAVRSRANRSVPERWLALLDEAARNAGVDRAVSLCESRARSTPMTWGLMKPVVFLPPEARSWDDDRLRAVLAHELAHVVRADWIVQLLVELIVSAYWFNPVMWIARRRLHVEAERACDDAVLNLGADRTDYATHLMEVARSVRRQTARVPAMARPGTLERRVSAVLNPSANRVPISEVGVFATAVTVLIAALPIAGFGMAAASPGARAASVLGVQRDIMMRLGGEERRFSIVTRDVSFWNNRIEGRVELQARLNVDGSVSGVRLVEPAHPDLASAARVIVRQWRREPARIRGVPVEVPIRMTVDFRR